MTAKPPHFPRLLRHLFPVPALIMEAADLLCDSLFRWLENQKVCAEKLLELAQELEEVHQESNIAQDFGAATSLSGTLPAIMFTGVLDSPLLVVGAADAAVGIIAATLVGISSSVTSTLERVLVSRSTLINLVALLKEDEKVGTSIQKQLQDLKDMCGGAQLGDHADELECKVTSQLMCALARRDNTHVPLDFLRAFNRATFYRHMTPGGLDPDEALCFICRALNLVRFAVIKSSLKVSAKEMMKNIGQIGIKAAVQAGSKVPSAIGLGLSLNDLIVKCEELVKGNQVTEASKFLRDSAREILECRQKLKEQLDAMHEIIQKLFRMKNLINDLGGYSLCLKKKGQKITARIKGQCTSKLVSWLQGIENQDKFLEQLGFVLENLGLQLCKLARPGGGHLDIVFVAHGRIVDQFMPADGLVPTPNIRDTILYSPWNCGIDSKAVYGIAQGLIEVGKRKLKNKTNNITYSEPDPLPDHWNSMQRSLHNIPGILLSPVTPEEEAWKSYQSCMYESMEIENRVIIPYTTDVMGDKFGEIPLYMFTFVTSVILEDQGTTATVHLAACLGRKESPLMPKEWRRQYAYTSDGTYMTMDLDEKHMSSMLLRAFRLMFDRNHR